MCYLAAGMILIIVAMICFHTRRTVSSPACIYDRSLRTERLHCLASSSSSGGGGAERSGPPIWAQRGAASLWPRSPGKNEKKQPLIGDHCNAVCFVRQTVVLWRSDRQQQLSRCLRSDEARAAEWTLRRCCSGPGGINVLPPRPPSAMRQPS